MRSAAATETPEEIDHSKLVKQHNRKLAEKVLQEGRQLAAEKRATSAAMRQGETRYNNVDIVDYFWEKDKQLAPIRITLERLTWPGILDDDDPLLREVMRFTNTEE